MKKINYQSISNTLSNGELKHIIGGGNGLVTEGGGANGGGGCTITCPDDSKHYNISKCSEGKELCGSSEYVCSGSVAVCTFD
ncbi:MAG: hypothetical protein LBD23_09375, partial [Oscillospiraceae bacterium]|jgi:hypothetical protein|nr:hypothetical protein [Oscillospiraceae bacterium]